ncbi:NAD-dependent epimerase/dehydratase [Isosphaera pallida ATCC 43644]|uniref:NAD-dependent epimerase/dehydratase n=1 Tax=Isosphaera pallida (strain ATCC 43644 / DSM 9630 / IS1B) TaxID=575540 RepID=E8R3I6_ISOPI|nr:SDR family NAD(P)-dependent oxidoreductase [Isosphaera pallida]ADV61553.1 NAD-dependent epimerase/dehydratase [Isosphaera pallida ATCC 43644]
MGGRGTVLVTGAAGFIGSHLVERLARDGHRVRAFIRYNGRDDRGCLEWLEPDVLAQVEVVRGDLKDPEAVRRAVRGCSRVFHLGALIAIPYSYENPLDVIQTNVEGTAHVLNACRDSDSLDRVVLTSTSEVYGTAQRVPIDESHPLVGQSPYAASKIGSDALGIAYHRSFGTPVTILRPFNTFGPRQSTRAIVPTILSQALVGSTLRLGSLAPRRDLTEVSDTVAGFVGIAECDEALGRVVNIGRGSDVSIGELVELTGQVLGRRLSVETDPQRLRPATSEVGRLLADASLARRLFGWEPRVSLEEGLRRVADHLRAHPTRRVGHYAT